MPMGELFAAMVTKHHILAPALLAGECLVATSGFIPPLLCLRSTAFTASNQSTRMLH